jgi:hypothetical protein
MVLCASVFTRLLPKCIDHVEERFFTIKWHPGFALSQKEKNIEELHRVAAVSHDRQYKIARPD